MKKNTFVPYSIVLILGISLLFIGFSACKKNSSHPQAPLIRTLSPGQAHNFILQQHGNASFSLLDIRSSHDFLIAHINGATHVTWQHTELNTSLLPSKKNAPILLYGYGSSDAKKAADVLTSLGYTSVFYIKGGLAQWQHTIQSLSPHPKHEHPNKPHHAMGDDAH